MKIAIDISPLQSGHKVRGVGFYLKHLKDGLEKYVPDNTYTFFTQGSELNNTIEVIHYPYFDPFFLTLPAHKKYKTVVTVHDLTPVVFPDAFPSGIKGKLRWLLQRQRLKSVDAIITDSESSKRDVLRLVGVPDEKVHVVLLAAGEEFSETKHIPTKSDLRKKFSLPEAFALYVGDVTWNKNVPRIIEAAVKADVPLVLVGKAIAETEFDRTNPWNRDRIRTQELSQNSPNIHRLGFISSEDLIGLYHAAEVMVMPSLYEGFGLPIIEAMTCGCPVITAKTSSLPEIAGESAYYVDPESIDTIAAGIKKVFSDKKLQEELRKKGKEQAKAFSWKKAALETNKVYEAVTT